MRFRAAQFADEIFEQHRDDDFVQVAPSALDSKQPQSTPPTRPATRSSSVISPPPSAVATAFHRLCLTVTPLLWKRLCDGRSAAGRFLSAREDSEAVARTLIIQHLAAFLLKSRYPHHVDAITSDLLSVPSLPRT